MIKNNDIQNLINIFKAIKNKHWIKSLRSGTTGIGYTFETLIGKNEENFELPDYYSIEIKTKHKYSKGFITLFNANPDGELLFPIERIINNFGYPDKDFPEYKVFNVSINSNDLLYINKGYKMQLKVDRIKKKIILIAYNFYNKEIKTNISWSFEMLNEKIKRKNNYLALVIADSKKIDNIEYFKYENIFFYKIKTFEDFINLIEKGIIRITFKISIFKSGKRKGQIHNHGTGFDININDISKLYNKLWLDY